MKELTIEEKARAYDEAIEALGSLFAEQAIKHCDRVYIKDITNIFPELQESEDERIKNIIKKSLRAYFEGNLGIGTNDTDYTDCFSWLEKRGEQKSIIIDIDKMVDEFAHTEVKGYGMPAMIEIDAYRKGVNDVLCRSLNLEKQGEQKPADKVVTNLLTVERAKEISPFMRSGFENESATWSEEDETTRNNISHIIRQYDKISKRNNQPCWYVGDCFLWMQNIKDRVQPQPKQGWSEEDEKIYQSIMDDTVQENQLDGKQINWLKSLKDRVQPQQEWSEEDKEIIETICKEGDLKPSEKQWLKSLRPQSQWKPSNEQMEALESATENCAYSEYQDCLRELIGQLKKLREK